MAASEAPGWMPRMSQADASGSRFIHRKACSSSVGSGGCDPALPSAGLEPVLHDVADLCLVRVLVEHLAGPARRLFGQVNDVLVDEVLQRHQVRAGVDLLLDECDV